MWEGCDFEEGVCTEVRGEQDHSRVTHPGLPRTEGSQDPELSTKIRKSWAGGDNLATLGWAVSAMLCLLRMVVQTTLPYSLYLFMSFFFIVKREKKIISPERCVWKHPRESDWLDGGDQEKLGGHTIWGEAWNKRETSSGTYSLNSNSLSSLWIPCWVVGSRRAGVGCDG